MIYWEQGTKVHPLALHGMVTFPYKCSVRLHAVRVSCSANNMMWHTHTYMYMYACMDGWMDGWMDGCFDYTVHGELIFIVYTRNS